VCHEKITIAREVYLPNGVLIATLAFPLFAVAPRMVDLGITLHGHRMWVFSLRTSVGGFGLAKESATRSENATLRCNLCGREYSVAEPEGSAIVKGTS
jgi:hypothetical protein